MKTSIIFIFGLLLFFNVFSQNKIILGNSFDKFIMRPHPDISLIYGNTSSFSSYYYFNSYLLGINKCCTKLTLYNKDMLVIDELDFNSLEIENFKQTKALGCKSNFLYNDVFIRIKEIKENVFMIGVVKKSNDFFYLITEIIDNKFKTKLEPIDVFNTATPPISKKEKKWIDKKHFPECFGPWGIGYISYNKNIFYYTSDPLAYCISHKKDKNDSIYYNYINTRIFYHYKNNQLTIIKSYFKKGLLWDIAEDINYVYYHNQEDLLIIDRNGNIVFEEKLSNYFKNVYFLSNNFDKDYIYAITTKNYPTPYYKKHSGLKTDTLITEIYKLQYDTSNKSLNRNKLHTILSNYPIIYNCKFIDGIDYYFQYSFVEGNNNLYKIKLNKDTINIITNYPNKYADLLNSNEKAYIDTTNSSGGFYQEIIFKNISNTNYSRYLKKYAKNQEKIYDNKTEEALLKSILIMLNDTSEYENLFTNYLVFEEDENLKKMNTSVFKEKIRTLKEYAFTSEMKETKEHIRSLLIKKNLIAEYKNVKAYENNYINPRISDRILFYAIIKKGNRYYLSIPSYSISL